MAEVSNDLRDYLLSLSNHIKLIYERLEKNEARLHNMSEEINCIKDSSLIKMDLKLPTIPSTQIEKPLPTIPSIQLEKSNEKAEGFWRAIGKKARARIVEESYGSYLQLLLEMDDLVP